MFILNTLNLTPPKTHGALTISTLTFTLFDHSLFLAYTLHYYTPLFIQGFNRLRKSAA